MSDRRLAIGGGQRRLVLKQERFFPAGTYTWSVPAGCESVDVFLVGGGGRGGRWEGYGHGGGGGGGYTKTFKADSTGWRDGSAITVTSGQSIQIIVGKGAEGSETQGAYSQFLNSSYRANGGYSCARGTGNVGDFAHYHGGNGGSGGSGDNDNSSGKCYAGSDGSSGHSITINGATIRGGTGQMHTTRDFGESTGKRNAGGGDSRRGTHSQGVSDYTEGSGRDCILRDDYGQYGTGGGGYGGGGGAGSAGGDGTVLIRYYAYE